MQNIDSFKRKPGMQEGLSEKMNYFVDGKLILSSTKFYNKKKCQSISDWLFQFFRYTNIS